MLKSERDKAIGAGAPHSFGTKASVQPSCPTSHTQDRDEWSFPSHGTAGLDQRKLSSLEETYGEGYERQHTVRAKTYTNSYTAPYLTTTVPYWARAAPGNFSSSRCGEAKGCNTCIEHCQCAWCSQSKSCLPSEALLVPVCFACGGPEGVIVGKSCENGCDGSHKGMMLAFFATFVAVPILIFVGALVFTCIFAKKYKEHVMDRKPQLQDVPEVWKAVGPDFRFGICDCFSDWDILLHTCCCTYARIADTYASAGLLSFWNTVMICIGISVARLLVGLIIGDQLSGALFAVIFAGVLSNYRGMLRVRLGGEGCTVMDFICLCCCPLCALCQEARQIDGAIGVRTSCCCNLKVEMGNTTGEPVLVLQPLTGGPQRELLLSQPEEMSLISAQPVMGQVVEGTPAVGPTALAQQALHHVEMLVVNGTASQDRDAGLDYTQMES